MLCTFLGLLLSTLIHAVVEILILNTITGNLTQYGDSFLWQNWELIHQIGSLGLWLAGFVGGAVAGFSFWQILYVEERYGKPRF